MKSIFKIIPLVLVMVMCLTVSVFAAETSYDMSANGDNSVVAVFDDETGVLTISGNGVMKDFTSSSNPIKSILTSVKKVAIENGVQNIGDYAFGCSASYCLKGLTDGSIVIPDSVTEIGEYAFRNGTSITSIELPATIEAVGRLAFNVCSSVESFTCLSTNVNIFEYDSFGGSINNYMGKSATGKTATINAGQVWLKESLEALGYIVTTSGSATIEKWESYPSSRVYEMGATNASDIHGMFNNYTGEFIATGSGEMKDYVATMGYANTAFAQNLAISSIVINEGITRVGNYAFYKAPATSISLPSSLTEIGDSAFKATLITSLTVPANVETIGAEAFSSNTQLTTLNFESGSKLKTIGKHAFYTAQALTSVEIPDGVTSIGEQAFKSCIKLESIIIPESVEYIGEMAFQWYGDSAENEPVVYNYGNENQYIGDRAFDTHAHSTVNYNSANTAMTNAVNSSTTVPTINYVSGGSGSSGSGTGGDGGSGGGGTGSGEGGSGGSGGSGEGGSGGGSTGSGEGGSGGSSGDVPGTEETMIIVDAEPTNFLVTVPIRIDVEMDKDGVVSTGVGYYVENECAMGPIIITDIKVVAETNWSLVDWDSDFHNMKASSKVIGLTINGVEVGADGSVVMNESLSSVIRNKESKELFFGARLSAQKRTLEANVAAVVFTVDFDKV